MSLTEAANEQSSEDTCCPNNAAHRPAALLRADNLHSAFNVAAVRVLSSGTDLAAAQAGVLGEVQPPRGRIQLEKRHLPLVQNYLHHPWYRPSGNVWTGFSLRLLEKMLVHLREYNLMQGWKISPKMYINYNLTRCYWLFNQPKVQSRKSEIFNWS